MATSTLNISLFSAYIDSNFSIVFKISPWLILAVIIVALIIVIWRMFYSSSRGPNFEIDKTEVGL